MSTERSREPLPGLLVVEHERAPGIDIVAARGEIDINTVGALASALKAAVEGGCDRVVVDLSEVSFIDSTGIRALLEVRRRLVRQERRLSLVCVEGGVVQKLLAMVLLVPAFSVHWSRESAVADGGDGAA